MDYLQYTGIGDKLTGSFTADVLNLIINGLPSILYQNTVRKHYSEYSFKPYYKWITFNT